MGKIINVDSRSSVIIQIICEVREAEIESVVGGSRKTNCVDARRLSQVMIHRYLGHTYAYIGRLFKRDHSTVSHSHRKHKELMMADSDYAIVSDACECIIQEKGFVKKSADRHVLLDMLIEMQRKISVLEEEIKLLKDANT